MSLPLGFRFAGVCCKIKKSGNPDLAMIVCDAPSVAAGVYTQNLVRASNIDWNRNITPTAGFRGLIINSGNANACTGEQGAKDNHQMAALLSSKLGARPEQICVLSTGVIGHLMPMEKVSAGIGSAFQQLGDSQNHFKQASTAILTTDKSAKTVQTSIRISQTDIRIAAMAKGAGMIGPNLATMLAVVTTDAKLEAAPAQEMLRRVADQSFNRISVEGHTSTNDALLLLASGASNSSNLTGKKLTTFEKELTRICIELAKQVPADGEGATHLMSISVSGAASDQDADRIARAIAQSALVKTAIAGADPNWGRIVSAAGYCGVRLEPQAISLSVNGFELFRAGSPVEFNAALVSSSMRNSFETNIQLAVGSNNGVAQHWASDLNTEYVRFNSEYHT